MEIEAATPPQTTQQYVLARLRRAILTGALPPGSPIRQDALAERFGVSRVPLREALKILEGNGQVIYRPRRGYVVAELSFDDLLEVYRLRELLEAEAARQAVGRMGEDDVRRLAEAHEDVVAAGKQGDVTAMATANRRFHFTLIDACGMPRLRRFLGILWDATDVYRTLYYSEAANRDRVEREHDGIVRAVRARDADLLVRLLDEHRAGTVATFRGFLTEQERET
ncbi:GntR family transcriptional regulator [Spongiactinospora gelatinilytica]|uniref:GntR family transcriptional regulator n=1 Tax=Spongiactinospora gelatinilytica TaxID=2666298 RepID=A0A2W2GJ43_9ACTN|nr:GntR family transcriptional regulator [Spongiactinospora gelatinilytica]PZG37118.1 GntR family transcriptional regulator [Spongiactinospora gelatinilytica]